MLLISVNAVFAFIFGLGARFALIRAIPFLRVGWEGIRAETRKPDYRTNVESRRAINQASNFLLGGVVWLVIAIGAAGFVLFFIASALVILVNPPTV